jgi:hypothetical protein
MSKLIELDAAIAETWKDTGYSDPLNVMTALRDRLEALPTVDAVPVVRCKDCLHNRACEIQYHAQAGDLFFCGAAERKDGDHEAD